MSQDAVARIFSGQAGVEKPAATPSVSPIQKTDTVSLLPVDALTDFPKQPFKPYTPAQLELLRESIVHNGILTPLLVRPLDGKYQILSGHNRRICARQAGYKALPCIIRDLDDHQAILVVVETNLRQREKLLPSEKAWAYRIRLEAMTHQGQRIDLTFGQLVQKSQTGEPEHLTSAQIGPKLGQRSNQALADQSTDSKTQIQRYIRLTYLEQSLLDAVDEQRLGFGVGVSLSYLSTKNQLCVYNFFMVDRHHHIDQRLADRLRELTEEELTPDQLQALLSPVVTKPLRKVSVPMKPLRRYFPAEATPKEIEKKIIEIVSAYFRSSTGEQ